MSTWQRHQLKTCDTGCWYCRQSPSPTRQLRVWVSKLFTGRNRHERQKEGMKSAA